MKPCKEPGCAKWFGNNDEHPEECDEAKCIFCGGYAQFFHNRMSFSCLDCDNHWGLGEVEEGLYSKEDAPYQ